MEVFQARSNLGDRTSRRGDTQLLAKKPVNLSLTLLFGGDLLQGRKLPTRLDQKLRVGIRVRPELKEVPVSIKRPRAVALGGEASP